MQVLVTGATGFVGRSLLEYLSLQGNYCVVAGVRHHALELQAFSQVELGDLSQAEISADQLCGIDVLVHAAARVHVMNEQVLDPLSAFRKVNVDGTLTLAQAAAKAGVKRFIYLSSIKSMGEETPAGQPFTEESEPAPVDPYGISKLEAEQALMKLASETAMEVVIIRPPLIYGAGVKGNFASLLKVVKRGFPLPLGAIHNKRSLVSLGNLMSFVERCLWHPAAAGQVFLISDGQDLSTTELLQSMAAAVGRPSYLLPVPAFILKCCAFMVGRRDMAQRLFGELQVDISKSKQTLGWEPSESMKDSLRRCV